MAGVLELVFVNETNRPVNEQPIRAHVERVFGRILNPANQAIPLQQSEVIGRLVTEIVFVGDQKIQALNRQFRGVDAPTDVLSFEKPDSDPRHPASVVISLDTAERQAATAGLSLEQEICTLATHGLLHVLGYGHA